MKINFIFVFIFILILSCSKDNNIIFLDNDKILRDYSTNKIKVIYVWASWCPDCNNTKKQYLNILNKLSKDNRFEIYTISLDIKKSPLIEYAKNSIKWGIYFEEDKVWDSDIINFLNIESIPSLFIYDGIKNNKQIFYSIDEFKDEYFK